MIGAGSEGDRTGPRPSFRLRRAGLALGFGVLLLLAARALDPGRLLGVIRDVRPVWLVAALGANLSILILWAAQWRLFSGRAAGDGTPPSFARVFGLVSVMATVSNSLPFFAGQATGVHLLARREEQGAHAALPVLLLDQLAEGAAKVALLLLLALLAPVPPELRRLLVPVTAGVAALGFLLVLGPGAARRVARLVASKRRLPLRRLARVIEALRSPGVLGGGVVLALAMKGAEAGGIVAVQTAAGVDLPLWATLLVLATVSFSTMVSVSPGNVGVYEAAAFAAYRMAGVDPATAAVLALLQHAAYLLPLAGTGWVAVTVGGYLAGVPDGVGEAGASAAGPTGSLARRRRASA